MKVSSEMMVSFCLALVLGTSLLASRMGPVVFVAPTEGKGSAFIIELKNGENKIDLNNDGTLDVVTKLRRNNGTSPHGYDMYIFGIFATSTGTLHNVSLTNAYDEPAKDGLNTTEGADGLLSDVRLIQVPGRAPVFVVAERKFGESYADQQSVTFTFYLLEENLTGDWVSDYYYKRAITVDTIDAYVNVKEAFDNELMNAYRSEAVQSELETSTTECYRQIESKLSRLSHQPSFDDFPATIMFDGRSTKLDLSSSPLAGRFVSYFKTALKEGAQFAGHYGVTHWGFTGRGESIGVVDLKDGKVYPFPYTAGIGFEYYKGSNLLIVDPAASIKEEAAYSDCGMTGKNTPVLEARPYYFLFEDGEFIQLNPQDGMPIRDDE